MSGMAGYSQPRDASRRRVIVYAGRAKKQKVRLGYEDITMYRFIGADLQGGI